MTQIFGATGTSFAGRAWAELFVSRESSCVRTQYATASVGRRGWDLGSTRVRRWGGATMMRTAPVP
jgi:hypothetical protein